MQLFLWEWLINILTLSGMQPYNIIMYKRVGGSLHSLPAAPSGACAFTTSCFSRWPNQLAGQETR